jgi:membrane protease YdiL (CAAX protease family)
VGGALFGLAMLAAAVMWTGVIRGRSLNAWFPAHGWALELLLGVLAGTGFAATAWVLIDRIPPLKAIARLLLSTLDMQSFSYRHALALGLVAGIPEEILFRGAIQPELGWVLTALIFGALHAITPAYFVYAATAGGVLGLLTLWRGSLWAAVAAHTAIDTVMFILLIHQWRRAHRLPSGD